MAREFVHTKTLPFWYPAVIFAACGVLFAAVWLNAAHLPTALTCDDEPNNVGRFIAERAQNLTIQLANLGPKVPGSAANRHAKELLLQQIELIRSDTHQNHQLEVDVQTANGSFPIADMTSVYAGVQNVIVRLSPVDKPAAHALLLNSHYDTVPISDGAGDDTFMVAVMLEVLRVLASSYIPHDHAIVFLFNGAEENGLQGSHPFVTQHPWARNVGAFINLDSSGAGGRDTLFQLTAGAGWLMRAYKQAVPHAQANVAVQEMFETGIVPSDTDFRVFRDFGGWQGVDIATSTNGYVYHTRHDRPAVIAVGSYQSVGDNVLELTRALANADELGAGAGTVPVENMVYFDFMGWFVIAYTTTHAIIINLCVSGAVVLLVMLQLLSFAAKSETSYAVILAELALIVAVQLTAIVVTGLLIALAAFLYDLLDHPLSWYTHVWLAAGLYGGPLLLGLLSAPVVYLLVYRRRLSRSLHLHKEFEAIMLVIRRSYHVQLFLHALALLQVVGVVVLTAMSVRSAYVLLFGVVFYGGSTLVNYVLRFHVHDTRWVYVHLTGQFLPFLFYANMLVQMLPGLVAIQGRSGTASNPEYMMGGAVFVLGWLAIGYLVPVVAFVRRPLWWLGGVALVWIIAVGVMFTPVGFPYRVATTEQRFWIFHTDRTFHSLNGSEPQSDQGYLLLGMDRNSNNYINDIVPGVLNATSTAQFCDQHLYCGLPLYTSRMMHQADTSLWLPTNHSAHIDTGAVRPTLTLVSNEPTTIGDTRRYTFDLSGPDHMNVYLAPAAENRLINWTFAVDESTRAANAVQYHGRATYFVFVGSGDDSSARHTVRFSVDIENKSRLGSALSFDIAAAGHYVHQPEMLSEDFREFLGTFPEWAHVTAWISSYESWQY